MWFTWNRPHPAVPITKMTDKKGARQTTELPRSGWFATVQPAQGCADATTPVDVVDGGNGNAGTGGVIVEPLVADGRRRLALVGGGA